MSFLNAFLTPRQSRIWDFIRSGLSQAATARKMNISRQAVNHGSIQANNKMTKALLEAAKLHKLQIETIDPKKGFITGYSPQARTKITILFTIKHGLQTWYHHNTKDCQGCPDYDTCLDTLKAEATRRGITFTEEELKQQPTQLAETIFTKLKQTLTPPKRGKPTQ